MKNGNWIFVLIGLFILVGLWLTIFAPCEVFNYVPLSDIPGRCVSILEK